MADPRFFGRTGPYRLDDLAARCGARLADPGHGDRLVYDVASLDQAGAEQLTFLDNPKYAAALPASAAGACILHEKHAASAPAGMALLLSPRPYHAYARVAQIFYPAERAPPGIHATATVDGTAVIAAGVAIGAGAVVEAGVRIGRDTMIGPGTQVCRNVEIGAECRIAGNVTLSHCVIGDRVTLHPGVRIGQDGFGFAPDPGGHIKVPQLGRVLIGDDCDIGANSTIDRGSGPDTVIGQGCWIDNLVQIGHNVVLGRGCIIIAQSGVAGSSQLGDFVVLAAQSGIAGHLKIGAGAKIGAKSGVMTDIPAGENHFGIPATRVKEYFRQIATLRRLAQKKGTEHE